MLHSCTCQGQVHKFYVNCLSCGLVICETYKSQLCPFCSENLNSSVDTDLLSEQLEKVILHRNKLLNNQDGKRSRASLISSEDDNYNETQ